MALAGVPTGSMNAMPAGTATSGAIARGSMPNCCATAMLTGMMIATAAEWLMTSVSAMAFFATVVGDKKIYQLLYNASSLSGFLIWLGIAICHLRFRKAWVAQARPSKIPASARK